MIFAVHRFFLYSCWLSSLQYFFFFHDPPPTEIYTLSLHDALPISKGWRHDADERADKGAEAILAGAVRHHGRLAQIGRAHSELQSRVDLVCRLLLEKKKQTKETEQTTGRELREIHRKIDKPTT